MDRIEKSFREWVQDTGEHRPIHSLDAWGDQWEGYETGYKQGREDKKYDHKKQLRDAHEFMLKTNGASQDERYMKDPDYWHDLGWEKDLEEYFNKYGSR